MTIAATIQQQLGNRTFVMLGAHCLIDHGDALSFKFRGSRAANYVKVTLAADDTYTVDFKKLGRNYSVKDVSETAGVYVDSLHALIESTTGLYTSL